jgi:hypothetical protein
MQKRYAALAIALVSLLAFVVLAAFHHGSAQGVGPSHVVPAPVEERPAVVPVPPSNLTTVEPEPAPPESIDPRRAEAAKPQQPAVRTGCGKAVPCPNRDCADCPHNIYLK